MGNRTKKTGASEISYTYNKVNQLTEVNSQTYTYDENGNLKNDGKYDYTWNAFDQLTEVKTVDGTIVGTYKYDENGRRIYSKVGTTETYFRYDGTSNLVLFEEDANGTITKEYTYDNNGHPLTLTYNNQTYYYLTNYRGDVLALTDANGVVVAEYTYDAWSNILTQSGKMATINPYRYAGYRYDDETKLYYLMARYYNPDTGVFLSLDSVRGDTMNPITMNGYNYANNNPVTMVDPDGEYAWAWWMAKGALRGGISAYLIYLIEVRLGIQKASTSNAIAQVAFAALKGAVLGGIGVTGSNIKKLKGLLLIAKKKKYLSTKQIRIANAFIYYQYEILNQIVSHFNTTPGNRSWSEVIYYEAKRLL